MSVAKPQTNTEINVGVKKWGAWAKEKSKATAKATAKRAADRFAKFKKKHPKSVDRLSNGAAFVLGLLGAEDGRKEAATAKTDKKGQPTKTVDPPLRF